MQSIIIGAKSLPFGLVSLYNVCVCERARARVCLYVWFYNNNSIGTEYFIIRYPPNHTTLCRQWRKTEHTYVLLLYELDVSNVKVNT